MFNTTKQIKNWFYRIYLQKAISTTILGIYPVLIWKRKYTGNPSEKVRVKHQQSWNRSDKDKFQQQRALQWGRWHEQQRSKSYKWWSNRWGLQYHWSPWNLTWTNQPKQLFSSLVDNEL